MSICVCDDDHHTCAALYGHQRTKVVSFDKPLVVVSLTKPTDRCTCCPEPRLVNVPRLTATGASRINHDNRHLRYGVQAVAGDPSPHEEFFHVGDHTFAQTEHVHFYSTSQDCDGPFYRDYVTRPNSYAVPAVGEQRDPDRFWRNVVMGMVSAHAIDGTLTVEVDPDGSSRSAVWLQKTEEGFRREEANWCRDALCAYEPSRQHDVYAEAAGY